MFDRQKSSHTAVQTPVTKVFAAALFASVTLLAVTAPGKAQAAMPTCMDRSVLAQQLDKKFSEAQVAVGLAASGQLVEVFSSDKGTTWTIVMTRADGTSCVMATGQAWHGKTKIVVGDPA